MSKRGTVYAKIGRCREWLQWMAEKHPQTCYFCGQPIAPEAFIEGNSDDGILIHHVDHDRTHNTPDNLVVAHRTCHRNYHNYVNRAQKALELPVVAA